MSIAYTYSSRNFRLTGTVALQRNPLDLNNWLLPAGSTQVAPPTEYTAEEVPVFNTDLNLWTLAPSDFAIQLELNKAEAVTQYGTPMFEKDGEGNWLERTLEEVAADDALRVAENTTKNLKRTMDQNIVAKALEVTGASSLESAQAFITAFALRASNPAEYVSEGLKVYWAIDTFSLGDLLDTEAKVKDYYTKVSIYLDKFRNTEINTYILGLNP